MQEAEKQEERYNLNANIFNAVNKMKYSIFFLRFQKKWIISK